MGYHKYQHVQEGFYKAPLLQPKLQRAPCESAPAEDLTPWIESNEIKSPRINRLNNAEKVAVAKTISKRQPRFICSRHPRAKYCKADSRIARKEPEVDGELRLWKVRHHKLGKLHLECSLL